MSNPFKHLVFLQKCFLSLLIGLWGCLISPHAMAHPHMWIDAKVTLIFNANRELVEIRQTWLFDEMFSSYAALGTDKKEKGVPDQSELDKIRNNWMSALADPMSDYFTSATLDGKPVKLGEASSSSIKWDRSVKRIALGFALPLIQPIKVGQQPVVINIADPTYFVSYDLTRPESVAMENAPPRCKASFVKHNPLDAETIKRLAAIPANAGALPPELLQLTQEIQNRVELTCP